MSRRKQFGSLMAKVLRRPGEVPRGWAGVYVDARRNRLLSRRQDGTERDLEAFAALDSTASLGDMLYHNGTQWVLLAGGPFTRIGGADSDWNPLPLTWNRGESNPPSLELRSLATSPATLQARYWGFQPTVIDMIMGGRGEQSPAFLLPGNLTTLRVRFGWLPVNTDTGNVRWHLKVLQHTTLGTTSTQEYDATSDVAAGGTAHVIQNTTLDVTLTSYDSTHWTQVMLLRDGAHANDTHTGETWIVGAQVEVQ